MHLQGADISTAIPSFSFDSSVLKLLVEALQNNGNKVAQIEASTGNSYTFADILKHSKSIATGLMRTGITEGDFVIICSSKSSLAYSLQLGVIFSGATAVLIHPQLSGELHKYSKGHSVKAVFYEADKADLVNQSLSLMTSELSLIAKISYEDTVVKTMLLSCNEFSLFEVKDIRQHIPLVLFTSGSTGDPKGVQISDLGLQRIGYSFVDESIQSYLLLSSFTWISSSISLVSSIFKGYTLILSESKEPVTHFQLIEKYKVNGWTIFSGLVNSYIKEATLSTVDLSSLTVINVGGAVLRKRLTEAFINQVLRGRTGVQSIYGMTEIGLVTTWRNHNLLDFSKADSSGYLAPGVEVKITDDEGNLVSSGELGDIRVKSISIMVGYWGQNDLNSQVLDCDGFFMTGDIGYFDQDGFLYVTGRSHEHVNYAGSKVCISDVEDLLKTHPDVLDASVISKAHPKHSYYLIAFVVLRPGAQVRAEDISVFINDQVGEAKRLNGGVYFIKEIPRTHTNKVHHGLLHELLNKLQTVT